MISVLKYFIAKWWDNRTEVFLIKYTLVYIYISVCVQESDKQVFNYSSWLGGQVWETRGSHSFKFFILVFLQCSLWMRARAMLSKTQKNTKSGLTESMQNIYISSTYFAVLIMLQLWAIKIQLFSYIRKKKSIIFGGRESENNQKGTGYLLQCVQRSGLGIFFVPLLYEARNYGIIFCVAFSFFLLCFL